MKKLIAVLLALLVVFLCGGCGSSTEGGETDAPYTEESTSEENVTVGGSGELITLDTSDDATEPLTTEFYEKIADNPFKVELEYYDDQHILYYVAPVTGTYRFDLGISDVTYRYEVEIRDHQNRVLKKEYSDCYTNGINVDFKKDNRYTIYIRQNQGFPVCTIKIGIPNDVETVEGNKIARKIEFIGQTDYYNYTAPVSGNYWFQFDTNNVEYNYKIEVYSSINEEIMDETYNNYGNGKNVYLNKGETYTIKVYYYNGLPEYDITIFEPEPEYFVDGNAFSGSIYFPGQSNTYYYTADWTGEHTVSIVTSNHSASCNTMLKTEKNDTILNENGEFEKTVYMNSGETYTFIISQRENFLDYTVYIR